MDTAPICLHWSLCNLLLIFHVKPKHTVLTASENMKDEAICCVLKKAEHLTVIPLLSKGNKFKKRQCVS